MSWRPSGVGLTMAAVVVVIATGIYGITAISDSRRSSGLGVFNACLAGRRFLVQAHHKKGGSVLETIRDRKRGTLVGEVTVNRRHPTTLGGAAAATDRYVMSTATSLGRDATAIEGCWDNYSPPAPDA